MINNRTIYLPALNGEVIANRDHMHKFGKSFRFFNENSLFYYPKFLISAGHSYKRKFIQELEINKEKTLVVGDSGGFQLCTGNIKYTEKIVEELFNWLEENTTYAMNLDFPPYIKRFTGEKLNYDKEEYFKEKLQISINNFEYFYKHRSGKTRYLSILHGRDSIELDKWYSKIKDFDFDGGWSIGSLSTKSSSDIYLIILTFFYLYEKGEINKFGTKYKNTLLHFLGFSKVKQMPILMYLQNRLNLLNLDMNLTFDSCTSFFTATFSHYCNSMTQNGGNYFSISRKVLEQKDINLDISLPCTCPVCSDVTFYDILKYLKEENNEENKSIFYLYLGLHNLFKFLEYKEGVENIIQTNSRFIYEDYFLQDIIKLINIIDKAFNVENPSKYIESMKYEIIKLENDGDKKDKNCIEEQKQTIF